MASLTKAMEVINAVASIIIFYLVVISLVNLIVYLDSKDIEEHKFSVRNATVVSFSYNTTTTTFTYNLTLFVTIPESCKSLDYVNATASYLNHRFASNPDESVVEGFTGLRMRFNGEYVVSFTKDQLLTLNNNHMTGLYNVTIRIWPLMSIHTRGGGIRLLKPVVLCDIHVPFQSRVSCDWTTD